MTELEHMQKYDGTAKEFALDGDYIVYMEKNYDGDTATLVFWLFNQYFKFNCRLYGLNCGELKSYKSAEEKELGAKAKLWLAQYNGQILKCVVHAEAKDPYKRPIVELFTLEGVSINDLLLHSGLAAEYYGHGVKTFK